MNERNVAAIAADLGLSRTAFGVARLVVSSVKNAQLVAGERHENTAALIGNIGSSVGTRAVCRRASLVV